MKPIKKGDVGAAVEDVQQRLLALDYNLGQECVDAVFGDETARAVREFRESHGLPEGSVVDSECWNTLVDETFVMGERSLYLRYPNFHGKDVRTLQSALNVLGFACGNADGIFGVHTESAVKEFQANVGLIPDGIAFEETFDAINRLRHVWDGKSPQAHSGAHIGLARTVEVIESVSINLFGSDPIARNIAGRIWNVATATTENSKFALIADLDSVQDEAEIVVELSVDPNNQPEGIPHVSVAKDFSALPARLRTACEAVGEKPVHVRVELEGINHYDGTFTARDAQLIAIEILDALCVAFDRK